MSLLTEGNKILDWIDLTDEAIDLSVFSNDHHQARETVVLHTIREPRKHFHIVRHRWLNYAPREPNSPHRNRLDATLEAMVDEDVLVRSPTGRGGYNYSPGRILIGISNPSRRDFCESDDFPMLVSWEYPGLVLTVSHPGKALDTLSGQCDQGQRGFQYHEKDVFSSPPSFRGEFVQYLVSPSPHATTTGS